MLAADSSAYYLPVGASLCFLIYLYTISENVELFSKTIRGCSYEAK